MTRPVLPVGSIVLWMGAAAPSGWAFCEGGKVEAARFPLLAKVFDTAFTTSPDGMLTLPSLGDFGPAKHIIRLK